METCISDAYALMELGVSPKETALVRWHARGPLRLLTAGGDTNNRALASQAFLEITTPHANFVRYAGFFVANYLAA